MSIAAVGTGEGALAVLAKAPGGVEHVVCNGSDLPMEQKTGTVTVWRRGSRVGDATQPDYGLDPNLNWSKWADWLKAPHALRMYDEVITTTLTAADIANWESVIPAIGSNDGAGTASRVVLFVAGNPSAPYTDRLLTAVLANPKVELGVEGYHQGTLYADMTAIRAEERAWKAVVRAKNLMGRTWFGISDANAPQYAAANPAYDSESDLARDADEDAIYEWLGGDGVGCPNLFVWGCNYSTERSRWMAADAIYRGLRRRYGVAP